MRLLTNCFLALSLFVAILLFSAPLASAQNTSKILEGVDDTGACTGNAKQVAACKSGAGVQTVVTNVINIFSVIVGIVSVIMIIIAGLKFITAGGDSSKVASARNTILYAVVGLIVVALAQTIVRFVLSKT